MLVSQEKYSNNSNNCNALIAFFKLFKFFKMQDFFFYNTFDKIYFTVWSYRYK